MRGPATEVFMQPSAERRAISTPKRVGEYSNDRKKRTIHPLIHSYYTRPQPNGLSFSVDGVERALPGAVTADANALLR